MLCSHCGTRGPGRLQHLTSQDQTPGRCPHVMLDQPRNLKLREHEHKESLSLIQTEWNKTAIKFSESHCIFVENIKNYTLLQKSAFVFLNTLMTTTMIHVIKQKTT